MLTGFRHHRPHTTDKIRRNAILKKIGHGVDENPAGLAPFQGHFKCSLVEVQLPGPFRTAAALARHAFVERMAHRLEPRRHAHGVAIGATGRENLASGDRIPGRVRPFDVAKTGQLSCSATRLVQVEVRDRELSVLDWHTQTAVNMNGDRPIQAATIHPARHP